MSFFSRFFSFADSARLQFTTSAESQAPETQVTNAPAPKLTKYCITGYPECRFFQKAQKVGALYKEKCPEEVDYCVLSFEYDEYHEHRIKTLHDLRKKPTSHRSCPLIYIYEEGHNGEIIPVEFTGGCDSFCDLMVDKHGAEAIALRRGWK